MKEYKDKRKIIKDFKIIEELYDLNINDAKLAPSHYGGRNIIIYNHNKVIRISKCSDRTYEDYLAEAEYVHFLSSNNAETIDVIQSSNDRYVEIVNNAYIMAFTFAIGDQIADHDYRYIEGRPLSEYFYNTGKTLGAIHRLSKCYKPRNKRFDFFDKYNEDYFDSIIPIEFENLKITMFKILNELRCLTKDCNNYGMVHFDFSDGNYNIDYHTGKITVFDFDNCRTFFYLFDLANLWTHGVGWIAYVNDLRKRESFMKEYFNTIIKGYRSETKISDEELKRLPLMIKAVLIENIIDEFEVQLRNNKNIVITNEQRYRIKCLVQDIDYFGFFDEIYDPNHPFEI